MKRLLHIPILVLGLYGNTFSQKTDAMLFGDVKDENHEHTVCTHHNKRNQYWNCCR